MSPLLRERSPRALARSMLHAATELLLPVACVGCARLTSAADRGIVCGLCWSRIARLPHPQCDRCGHPWPSGALRGSECQWCALLPPYVRSVRSVCWLPSEPAGRIVHALKYRGWSRAADPIAAQMARLPWPSDVVRERGGLVPVPLATGRLRERGYNQSLLLANALGQRWDLPVLDILQRVRETTTQTRLSTGDRQRNVADAFMPRPDSSVVSGMHLVVVDDVVTTAATLNQCAAALYSLGARIISYVTFGRARAAGDRL